MQGSFSDPPIVFTQPRFFMLAIFLIAGFFNYELAVLLPGFVQKLVQKPTSPYGVDLSLLPIAMLLLLVVFTTVYLAVLGLRRFIAPATLSLGPDGMTLKIDGRVRHFEWRGISNVRRTRPGRWGGIIVFDYPRTDAPGGWLRRLDKRMGGSDFNLGGYWDTGNFEVIETIREAREKWLDANPPRSG